MLKPVTEHEKATFTIKHNFQKAVEELLYEIYSDGFNGTVDIYPIFSVDQRTNKITMEVKSEKVSGFKAAVPPGGARFHVQQGKGCKKIS